MPSPNNNPGLHGNVPDQCEVVLLLIDVLNHLDFEGAEGFAPRALEKARNIAELKRRAKRARIPVIYVNDNMHGRWRSDLGSLLAHWRELDVPGRPLLDLLPPEPDDYVVLKPKHSGFFATPLETVLAYQRVRRLILTGFTTDQCVLFTASDAFLHDYALYVPRDCTDTVEPEDAAPALRLMEKRLHVVSQPSTALDLAELMRKSR